MNCRYCGYQNDGNAIFCGQCGFQLVDEATALVLYTPDGTVDSSGQTMPGTIHKKGFNLKERYPEALSALDEALRLNAHTVGVHLIQARSFYELGKYEEALLEVDKASRLSPADSVYATLVYLMRGLILESLARYGDAVIALNEVRRLTNDLELPEVRHTALNLTDQLLWNYAPFGWVKRGQTLVDLDDPESEERYRMYPVERPPR